MFVGFHYSTSILAQHEMELSPDGIVFPRMTTAERNALTPIAGQFLFNTDSKNLNYYDGSQWIVLSISGLTDEDGDTRITVEETSDNDIISMYSSGNPVLTVSNNVAPTMEFKGSIDDDMKIVFSESASPGASLFYEGSAGTGSNNKIHIRSELHSGSNLMTFKLDGNIGIGVTEPVSPLSFEDNVANEGFNLFSDYQILLHKGSEPNTSYGMGIRNNTLAFNSRKDIDFDQGGTTKMTLKDGNLGIGSTTPNTKLDIEGGTDARLDGGGFVKLGSSSGKNMVIDENEIMARDNGLASDIYVNHHGGNTIINGDNGNVGIGSYSPSTKLHIEKGSDVKVGGGGFLTLGDPADINIAIDNNEIMSRDNGNTADLILNADGGRIGIGTFTPNEKLDVNGNLIVTGEIKSRNAGSANMIPICYGIVDEDGTILSGTGNFSSTRNGEGDYTISVTGYDLNLEDYVILYDSRLKAISYTVLGDNNLHIHTNSPAHGLPQDSRFSFMIYTP